MAIDDLLEHLDREAAAEVERVLRDATEEARALEERAAAEAERQRSIAVARLEADTAAEIRRGTASAERAARERVLTARAAVLERVFAEARRRLASAPAADYRHRLPDLVAETLRYLAQRPIVLVVRPDAVADVERLVVDPSSVRLEVASEAAPGVLGRSGDGSVAVDNTLPARLVRMGPDLSIGVARRLAGDDDAMR